MTDSATQKQIDYIIDLGGSIPEGLSKSEASRLIQQLLEDRRRRINTDSKPPVDDNQGGCLGLVIIVGLIIGAVYLFNRDTSSHNGDYNAAESSYVDSESGEIVYISRYGDCYHLYSDCISLDNINAYVEVYERPLSSVTNTHRLCEICRRNAGL